MKIKSDKKKTVSFLASGRGSNFTAVAENIISGNICADIGVLITDKANAKCKEKAARLGIDSFFIDPKNFNSREDHEKEIIKYLEKYNTDLVVASGYMRLLTPLFINRYKMQIINIHPSLLPSFAGKNAQKQALEHGVKISGCTTHFMDEGTDTGPIILQAAVEIKKDDNEDTLSARILEQEHRILSESVKLYCEDKISIYGRKVIILS
ncbi:MAG TPA: phosphoribosylglycinamide formyltransferase [Spirochaetota bacterium]|nr:phosphoribosylglycinamide formyltransferase [Spirochaetota bacterium]